ncbi:MAG: toll/interleukin-1 receptor domain-containing protein [Clostridia bacterium]|nr:toll/interleukin-1 receptor domain-containing protein [Clostridia bacterium]
MVAYEGNEKYIFVSYAHKDSEAVISIIGNLHNAGFRLWYDLGIEAGTEWPAYIEEHLDKSEVVMVFISRNSIESINCRNEINYALLKKKEMLVVYLEDAELKYGLGLQLNSMQSMYRSRHSSMKTFMEQLEKSKILQSCRGHAGDTSEFSSQGIDDDFASDFTGGLDVISTETAGDPHKLKEARKNGPSLISRIAVKGAKTLSDLWPDTPYTQIINIDEYMAVRFHCQLVKEIGENANKSIGMQIYDSEDSLVFEDISDLHFSTGHDRFSLGWTIRSENGIPAAPGKYTVLIWMENSRVTEYTFHLVSSQTSSVSNTQNTPKGFPEQSPIANHAALKAEKEDIMKKLAYPKLTWMGIFSILLFYVSVIGLSFIGDGGGFCLIIFGIPFLIVFRKFYKNTKQFVVSNGLLAFLLVSIGGGYYTIFLIIMNIVNGKDKKRNKQRLKELEQYGV